MTLLLSDPPAVSTKSHPQQRQSTPRPEVQTPSLSVVIVNYCQWENTSELVQQICESPHTNERRVEVVIVDNHSPGDRVLSSLRRQPGVSLRRWGRNRGFARAVNEGCRLSQGNWLLLLNPDISVSNEFLDGVLRLCTQMENDPRVGIVGFQLQDSDGRRQLSWGPFPTLAGTMLRMLLPRRERKYSAGDIGTRSQVPWVTGCCLLVRRECLQQLAGLDDNFFLYYEDVDFCRRARALGWSVWFEPKLKVVHHHPLHSRTVPAILRLVTRHSLLTYAKRHWRPWQMRTLARIVCVEASVRRLWSRLRGDARAAAMFGELRAMARDFGTGCSSAVRQRFQRVLREHQSELEEYANSPE